MAQAPESKSSESDVTRSLRLAQEHVQQMYTLAQKMEKYGEYGVLRQKIVQQANRGQSTLENLQRDVEAVEANLRKIQADILAIDNELVQFNRLVSVLELLRKVNANWSNASQTITSEE
jgi:hypothetical protein